MEKWWWKLFERLVRESVGTELGGHDGEVVGMTMEDMLAIGLESQWVPKWIAMGD